MVKLKVMEISNNPIKKASQTPRKTLQANRNNYRGHKDRFKTCRKVEMNLLQEWLRVNQSTTNHCLVKDNKINLRQLKLVIVRQLQDKVEELTLRSLHRLLTQAKVMMLQRKCKFFLKNKLMRENKEMTMRCNPRKANLKLCKEDSHQRTQTN
jgi:hypothetical protein